MTRPSDRVGDPHHSRRSRRAQRALAATHILRRFNGQSRKTLFKLCAQEGVPVFHGRIDKTLFVQTMTAAGHRLPDGVQDLDDALLAPG